MNNLQIEFNEKMKYLSNSSDELVCGSQLAVVIQDLPDFKHVPMESILKNNPIEKYTIGEIFNTKIIVDPRMVWGNLKVYHNEKNIHDFNSSNIDKLI